MKAKDVYSVLEAICVCCPKCGKFNDDNCDKFADDCDVFIYLKNKKESEDNHDPS